MSDPFAGATLNEPRFLAAVKLIERTGATGYEVAASLSPVEAVLRLCEQLIDGGQCRHCGQNTIFDPDPPSEDHLTELLDRMGCRYAWDPELATFRRSCEGADR